MKVLEKRQVLIILDSLYQEADKQWKVIFWAKPVYCLSPATGPHTDAFIETINYRAIRIASDENVITPFRKLFNFLMSENHLTAHKLPKIKKQTNKQTKQKKIPYMSLP